MSSFALPAEYLNSTDTGRYLGGLSPFTLRNWRSAGKGPAFIRVGSPVFYARSALDAYMSQNGVGTIDQSSTRLGERAA